MKELLIWGATGHSKVLLEALSGRAYHLVALVDNRAVPSPVEGVPVLPGAAGLDAWLNTRGGTEGLFGAVAIGGGRGRDRVEIQDALQKQGVTIITIIHNTAFAASDALIGEGCQILAQAAVCSHAQLARGVIVNTAASVDHDCIINDGVHLAPGARLAGEVIINQYAFIGMGALVLPRLTIGANSIVGAGAVVTKDVPPGATVKGCPARTERQAVLWSES